MSKNLSELSGRQGLKNNLFDRMGKLAQEQKIYSNNELENLAQEFLVGNANTYGTATFYDFLKPENKNKKVYVCNGSACLCAGTQESLITELKQEFSEDEIGHMTCLGRCHENGAFHYQGKNYSALSNADIEKVISGEKLKKDTYKVQTIGTPVLTAEFEGFNAHYQLLGDILTKDREEVLKELAKSGIRGRGGAGFPMASKFKFCKEAESDTKFIICNADEGDPGAFSDRYLLEERPHSVLFGMMVAGYVTGAEWGVVYIRAEYPESVEIIEEAVRELYANDLLGDNILDSGFNFNFKVIMAQGSYICGEETALINSLEGQRPEVRVRPPYPAQKGLFNKPTVVNNVETLAAIHYILKNGGQSYATLGTEKSTGTKLISLDSYFNQPGICEVEMGTPLKDVVYNLGGGFREPVKALHIGGPLGGLVPTQKIEELTVDFESFNQNGFLLGHASVVSLPESFPIIKYLEHIFDFAAYESCGKCFPCRLGTHRGYELIHKAINEDYKIDNKLFDDLLYTLETGSLCAHGGGIPLPVRNSLVYFKDELSPYFN
jgi:NADH-quinone oxidoreductase subunit F